MNNLITHSSNKMCFDAVFDFFSFLCERYRTCVLSSEAMFHYKQCAAMSGGCGRSVPRSFICAVEKSMADE